jgi:hypothetical protein
MKTPPKRMTDVRVQVLSTLFPEYNIYWRGPLKGEILDGHLDEEGNFHCHYVNKHSDKESEVTIYPSHFKILGKFYFRKARSK